MVNKFFTSYYANLNNIPTDYACVGISRFCPDYLKVSNTPSNFYFWDDNWFAPSIELLSDIKNAKIDESTYLIRYYKELNNKFHFKEDKGTFLISYLEDLKRRFFDYNSIVFLCYENPDKFCHRHLLRKLFIFYGVDISELLIEKTKNKSKGTQKVNALF